MLKLTSYSQPPVRFCLDCNIPSSFESRLANFQIQFIHAPPAKPDREVMAIAIHNHTPILTYDVGDFMDICATRVTHPGVITFPGVSRHFSKEQSNACFASFAKWVSSNPDFDYSSKLSVVRPNGELMPFKFNIKDVYKKPGQAPVPPGRELKCWREFVQQVRRAA